MVFDASLTTRGMESESGSQLERSKRAGMAPAEAWAWGQAWLQAWPRARTVAMQVELDVQEFGRPRPETRAEADAWAPALMRVARIEADGDAVLWTRPMEPWTEARAEALALAGVCDWERSGGRARGESVPSGLAGPSTIKDILSTLNRYGVGHDLWHRSPETRAEYSCITHFIAPVTRLPFELLHHIFLIIIDELSSPPEALMLVCKHWNAIVTTIWASLNLGTRTPMGAVTRKLKRNQWLLDIVVDTDADRGDFTPSIGAFEAIFAAIEASSRWRRLVVESFPAQADIPEELVNHRLKQGHNATMSRFTTFKIKSACKTSPLLNGLLRILGTTTGSELTTVEINSANVISFLAPDYPSMFNFVKVLSLDTRGLPNPVDLLPHLHHLETFNASHLSLPIYHNDVNLPFVHTLRHLSLRAVSIQWMSGRTFHVLEDCTLIFPLHRHVLHTFSTTLPNCTHLTFQGAPLNILNGISAHKLSRLSVTYSGPFNGRGSQQLLQLSHHVLGEHRLAPKILHIGIEATNQAWVNALNAMSGLEVLVIDSAAPSSLGARVVQSLIVQPVHGSGRGVRFTPGGWREPLCPSLKQFGLKYRRWLRRSEHFNLIPDFVSVIMSRQYSNYSLQGFSIWMTSDQKEPLELIKALRMSRKGLKRLANESVITGERPSLVPYGDWDRQEEYGIKESQVIHEGLERLANEPPSVLNGDRDRQEDDSLELIEESEMIWKGLERFLNEKEEMSPSLPRRDQGPQKDCSSSVLQAKVHRGGGQAEVGELPRRSVTGTLKILRPSSWFPTLVESAARFARKPNKVVE